MDARDYIIQSSYGFKYGVHPMDAIISPEGEIIKADFCRHYKVSMQIVDKNGWTEEYKCAFRNRGYSDTEFLVLVKNYITIHQGTFHFSRIGRTTVKQKAVLGCDPREEYEFTQFERI